MQTVSIEPRLKDVWSDGQAYEYYVGRWSRHVAREFIPWLAVPAASRWLDIGCGTGALSQTILETAAPDRVDAIDRSSHYAAFAREQLTDRPLSVAAADAQALPFATGTFHAVVSGLMLNFVREPARAVAEMARVVRPGGVVAAFVWDYAGKMEFMRYFWDAAVALDGGANDLEEGRRFPLCQPQPLTAVLESAGLQEVQVRAVDIATVFRDFDDYWHPFLGGQGSAPTYLMSLNNELQIALREHVRARLPFAPDGSIPLTARAWAVRGRR